MDTSEAALEVDHAIVLLLGAPARNRNPRRAGRLEGTTRLEKLIFLLERETSAAEWLTEDAGFEAYDLGPFSAKVYQAVDMLSAADIIEVSTTTAKSLEDEWECAYIIGSLSDPYVTRAFVLTDRGWRYYSALLKGFPREALSALGEFKERFADLPLRQLVRYVFQRYEDFTVRSTKVEARCATNLS